MRTLKLLLSFLVVCSLATTASAQQVGDKYVVITDNVSLRSQDTTAGSVPKGEVLIVKDVNGDRLWVKWTGRTGTVKGWINRSDVLPVSQALDLFEKELNRSPTSRAYAIRGGIRYEMDEYHKAIADYNEAIRLDPKDPMAYNNRGSVWLAKEEYDKAIADSNQAIRLDPKFADAYLVRGDASFNKMEYDKAISDFNEALRLDTTSGTAHTNRGAAWMAKGDLDKAFADFNEAIRIDPKDASAHSTRGSAWMQKGELDEAFADFNKAIRIDPKDASAYANRGSVWAAKREFDKALADFDEAIRVDPKSAQAYNDRAHVWMSKAEYDKVIADCTMAILLQPDGNSDGSYGRGLAWNKKCKFENAIADYEEAIRINPTSSNAYWGLARLLATCPDPKYRNGKRALETAERARERLGVQNAHYAAVVAAAFAEAGDFDAAINWQTKACEMISKDPVPRYVFGEWKRPDSTLRDEFKSRLELYNAHKPYHEEVKKVGSQSRMTLHDR